MGGAHHLKAQVRRLGGADSEYVGVRTANRR
jgi:hypothetical protein